LRKLQMMSWGNQMGFCPNCKMQISIDDFISGGHDVVCEKSPSAK
jgi:hypothetical protein